MKRKLFTIALATTLIGSLSGCVGCTYEETTVKEDTETTMMDVKNPSLHRELTITDEDFELSVDYDTDGYDLENWHVTDSKVIGMKVKTSNLPEGYEVYIDHVHADISLKSTSEQINGISQDSMDDTFHGQSQDGFYIDNDAEYYNVFAVDGYTDQFYQIWGRAFGDYGSISSSYERLTEENIIRVGTYAEQLSVVYDISIKKPGSDKLYTKSVSDKILIPVSQDAGTQTVTKDVFTGKEVSNE